MSAGVKNGSRGSLGLRNRHVFTPGNLPAFFLYLIFCALIISLLVEGAASSGYFWQWTRVSRVFLAGPGPDEVMSLCCGPLARGLAMTLRIGAVSLCAALLVAMTVTVMRLIGGPVARALAVLYVQLVRNTPLLVQILFIYFVVAPGFGVAAEASAIITLSLFEGAYLSEIFRAGALAVPRGQWEAALSLGIGPFSAVCGVVLPQALRHALPPLLGECVTLVKNTSLASIISVTELTFVGKKTISDTFMSLEIWLVVALVYLCLAWLLSVLAWLLCRRLNRAGAWGESGA